MPMTDKRRNRKEYPHDPAGKDGVMPERAPEYAPCA